MQRKLTVIVASLAALAIVIGVGLYARDAKLMASDENVYAAESQQEEESSAAEIVVIESGEAEETAEEAAESEEEILLEETETAEEAEESSEEVEEEVEKTVVLTSNVDDVEEVEEGTEVVLSAELTGFDENATLQWQYSEDGETWIDVEGAVEASVSFTMTQENENHLWRVVVNE